jgi:hypothetical protein
LFDRIRKCLKMPKPKFLIWRVPKPRLRRGGAGRTPGSFAARCAVALVVFSLGAANALEFPRRVPNGFTWGELAILPPYCADTQGTVWDIKGNGGPLAPNTPKWVAMMGEDFFHVHHYCYGLRHLLHAQAAGENTARGKDFLRRAQREFAYMFRAASPSMLLMPEIHLKDGEVHLKLGNLQEANLSFERARTLKPDYWPAYTRWADVLVGLKLHDAARKLLEEGLAHSPGQPELTRRLVALPGAKRARSAPTPARSASSAAASP